MVKKDQAVDHLKKKLLSVEKEKRDVEEQNRITVMKMNSLKDVS